MVCTTLGTIKQAPKPSRISREINAHVVHAFPVQLQAKGTKISENFNIVCFLLVYKSCTSEVTLVYAVQAIRRHY